ncbi:MAG: hypothetical protein GYB50_18775 [Rhodobacteraceae bacterium]|nr:hypothetical protein [Paracoccaceae bacterium]
MSYRIQTRADDELVLSFIALRRDGRPIKRIAREFGTSPQRVSIATNRVMAADQEEEGADLSVFYWQ